MEPLPRLCRIVLRLAELFVPRSAVADFRLQWQAELHHRHSLLERFATPGRQLALLWHAVGALPHAFSILTDDWSWDMFMQDLRYALRTLRKSPGFTLVAVLILGVGIGGVAGAFSIVDAFLLRPLPFDEPERLVHFYRTDPQTGADSLRFSLPTVLELREKSDLFEDVGAYEYGGRNLAGGEGLPQHVMVSDLTVNLLPLLGAEPQLGRTFSDSEGQPGAERVALLEYGLWQSRFGGRQDVLGQNIRLDGVDHAVIGVLPPNFYFPFGEVKVWTPLAYDLAKYDADYDNLQPVARLAPNVTPEQARLGAETIYRRVQQEATGEAVDYGVAVRPLREALIFLYELLRISLLIALAANGIVLLVICGNVASVMLSRATGRERETAIRSVLGASRTRIVRQLLVEGSVLALVGGVVGIALAYWQTKSANAMLPEALFRVGSVEVDPRALIFTLLICVVTTLLFALAPALQVSRTSPIASLKGTGADAAARRSTKKLRSLLVVSQVSLAVVLLASTSLLIRSALRMQHVDPGFEPKGLLTLQLKLPQLDYPTASDRAAFYERALSDVSALAGVESAAFTEPLPLNFASYGRTFAVEGREPAAANERLQARQFTVSAGFHETMGIPLAAGRVFDRRDTREAPRVVVINQTMAERYWPGDSAVGKRIAFARSLEEASDEDYRAIVGVVADSKTYFLNEAPSSIVYLPETQATPSTMFFVVRTQGAPLGELAAIRQAVWKIHPELPLAEVRTMEEVVEQSLLPWTGSAWGLLALALVALILAALGIYGVVAYATARRLHEIGIRRALGAERVDVLRLVLGQGARLTLLGLALGGVGALVLSRLFSGLLFGVGRLDPLTAVGVPALLLLFAVLATLPAARRALSVEPAESLRYE